MPVDTIDWLKLKPYREDKRESFEQLCYQVARALYSELGTLTPIDDSGGGSGVEFYLELTNGDIWGWQAKFYPGPNQRVTDSRRRHILESLRATKQKYGARLKQWFLCTAIDFSDKGDPSELEWFNRRLKKAAGRTELKHWGDSELLAHLAQPKLRGILQFFFGVFQPRPEWFKLQVAQQLENIPDKYIPQLHTRTSADFEIHALLGNPEFFTEAAKVVKRFSKLINEFKAATNELRAVGDVQFATQIDSAANRCTGLAAKLDVAFDLSMQFASEPSAASPSHDFLSSLETLRKDVEDFFSLFRKDLEPIETAFDAAFDRPRDDPERQRLWRLMEATRKPGVPLDTVLTILWWLARYCSLRKQMVLHLIGDAGTGKTHVLAHLCSTEGVSGIFLRGISFSKGRTIEAQILEQLGLNHIEWSDFASALSTFSTVYGHRILIGIDALNEAGSISLWQEQLAGFAKALRPHENIALVTSCRASYQKAIWRTVDTDSPVFWHVTGFAPEELKKAIPKYFDYYRISATITLAAREQFSHPLYLRIFCEAENRPRQQVKQVFLGQQNLFGVFEKYLATANVTFSERTNRPVSANLLNSLLRKFARQLWTRNARTLPYAEAMVLFDGVLPDKVEWNSSNIKALLEEDLILSRSYADSEEAVEFSYDLLAGYLIADQALNDLPSDFPSLGSEKAAMTVGKLFEPLVASDFSSRHPLHEDILRSAAAIFPARTGRQLAHVSQNRRLFSVGVHALFEMDPQYLTARETSRVEDLFDNPENRPLLLADFKNTAFSPQHPLNAEFLAKLLGKLPMADRDLAWSEYLAEHVESVDETIHEFLQACKPPFLTPEEKRQLRLAALYLSWILTSTNRYLRDAATRTLMVFGVRFPRSLFNLMEESLSCNDPYVPERMLAACYGVAMVLHCRPAAAQFSDHVLPLWARSLFVHMFAGDAKFSTTHSLTRDYAKGIVELALRYHPTVLTPSERDLIKPPFKGGIRDWQRRPDYDRGKYRDGNSPFGMDWENYTLRHLAVGSRTYQFEDPRFIEVKEKILWRIHVLGYSLERFGEIDKVLFRRQYHGGGGKSTGDRYGEKYAWIAFYELYGLLEDEGKLKKDEWYDSPHPYQADIDPSFPNPPHRQKMLAHDLLGTSVSDSGIWVSSGPSPNFKSYLVQKERDGEAGPWLLLHAFFSHFAPKRSRNAFATIRAFFVKNETAKQARNLLVPYEVQSGWLSHIPEARGFFAGELPWSSTLPYAEFDPLEFPVGKKRVRNKQAIRLALDLGNGIIDMAPETQKKWRWEPVYEKLNVEPAVQSSAFDDRSPFDRPTGIIPSKQISEHSKLWLHLPSWDMCDGMGTRISISTQAGSVGSLQETLYMRQDTLEQYLIDKSLTLIWIVWGERQRLTSGGSDAGYKQYKQLYWWRDGTVQIM